MRRFLGLDLAGAKNQKTAVAALEYYPKEGKIFLIDIYEKLVPVDHQSSDETLLDVLSETGEGAYGLGVNVPVGLPPCILCTKKTCPLPAHCSVQSVKWMREITKRAHRHESGVPGSNTPRVLEFTPYTQRPVELWVRYGIMPEIPEAFRFEIDETLGGNRAPLTARMHFLRRHLPKALTPTEVWPKLTLALLAQSLDLPKHWVKSVRHLEQGAHARQELLEILSEKLGIFIYERDQKKLSLSLSAFDAFLCAYTALLSDIGQCSTRPKGFPKEAEFIAVPDLGKMKRPRSSSGVKA